METALPKYQPSQNRQKKPKKTKKNAAAEGPPPKPNTPRPFETVRPAGPSTTP